MVPQDAPGQKESQESPQREREREREREGEGGREGGREGGGRSASPPPASNQHISESAFPFDWLHQLLLAFYFCNMFFFLFLTHLLIESIELISCLVQL